MSFIQKCEKILKKREKNENKMKLIHIQVYNRFVKCLSLLASGLLGLSLFAYQLVHLFFSHFFHIIHD